MCYDNEDNEERCKIWKGIDLSVQNWHEESNKFWPKHSKISKICTLMGCFWPKYSMLQLRKYREVKFDGTQDWLKNLKENWSVVSKMTRIWWILIQTLKSSRNVHFDMFFPVMFDRKKSSGVIFHDTREWCKIWRKTDFCFKKSQEKFEKFSPEHLKISKLELWWDSFVQSWKCMSLRFTGKLCVMRMKNGPKIEELISQFKTDMNNLTNFDSSTQKSQKFAL